MKTRCELLICAGSAGSLEILMEILPELDPGFNFPVLIVMHRSSHGDDAALIELFEVKTSIPVKEIEDKEKALPGTIYIAPKDYHVLCERDHIFSLDASEKVNFSRPSIDVTFESAAAVYGSSLVVVLLSGGNTDGTEGIRQVKKFGGTAIVQDPSSAKAPYMPQSAIENAPVDHVCGIPELASRIKHINQDMLF